VIDLHCHTSESDGTDSPERLLQRASAMGLAAIAITDHDTINGCDTAELAVPEGLRLIRGIELSTRRVGEPDPRRRLVHLLGYFFAPAPESFRAWLESLRGARRARNVALAEKLRRLGVEVRVEEAEAFGRNVTGRPHFARVMIEKGFVKSYREAFDNYLGEGRAAYVERADPDVKEGLARLRAAGAVISVAHPIRLNQPTRDDERRLFEAWREAGLQAIEAIHPDHDKATQKWYRRVAADLGMVISGGTDFHGHAKPDFELGSGFRNNVRVGLEILDGLQNLHVATVQR
jgi:predicted metal-dependent phosphoesterase TrpH